MDCFSNHFTTDTGTPAKNIPSIDEIDNEGTVFTFWSLKYSISSPRNSDISTILEITIATATTTDIGHMAPKEIEKEGDRHSRAARGYCNRRLSSGNICLKKGLWDCNSCLVCFGRRTYYCRYNGHDCSALHHEPLVINR